MNSQLVDAMAQYSATALGLATTFVSQKTFNYKTPCWVTTAKPYEHYLDDISGRCRTLRHPLTLRTLNRSTQTRNATWPPIKESLGIVRLTWRFTHPLAGKEEWILRAWYEVWTNVDVITWIWTHLKQKIGHLECRQNAAGITEVMAQ